MIKYPCFRFTVFKYFYAVLKLSYLDEPQSDRKVDSRADKKNDRKWEIPQYRNTWIPPEIRGKIPEKVRYDLYFPAYHSNKIKQLIHTHSSLET